MKKYWCRTNCSFFEESFLNSDLSQVIRYAKENIEFDYMFLTTNGLSVAIPDKVEKYFQASLNFLKFSLNYTDEEQFSNIAKVNSIN